MERKLETLSNAITTMAKKMGSEPLKPLDQTKPINQDKVQKYDPEIHCTKKVVAAETLELHKKFKYACIAAIATNFIILATANVFIIVGYFVIALVMAAGGYFIFKHSKDIIYLENKYSLGKNAQHQQKSQ